MTKRKGMLRRPNVSVDPIEPANPVVIEKIKSSIEIDKIQTDITTSSDTDDTEKSIKEKNKQDIPKEETNRRSDAKFKNQASQIKLSQGLKEEINALKSIRKIKFDYELIELLIDSYVEQLDKVEQRKFKAFTDN